MTHRVAPSANLASQEISRIHGRLGAVLLSHSAVDVYSAFVPPLLGILQLRHSLTDSQAAWLLSIGSLGSGLSQPLAAWISDKIDSRLFGALGLVIAAVCLSSIGLVDDYSSLVVLYLVGVIGVGIFHPIGASCMGELSDQLPTARRSVGMSFFFVAGMAGGISGALIASRLSVLDNGFRLLQLMIIPGLLVAGLLHLAIRNVPHRQHGHHTMHFDHRDLRQRWGSVVILWMSNAGRFTVNMALVYLVVPLTQGRLAMQHPEWSMEEVVEAAAPTLGDLNALLILGMAIGGLSAGTLTRAGREKWPMILIPLAGAPVIAMIPILPISWVYVLIVIAGIGFASTVPVALTVGQRLLPHRTSLASGLMLGGAWWVAVIGPQLAERCLNSWDVSLERTFLFTGVLLAAAGLVNAVIPSTLLRDSALARSAVREG